MFGKSQAATFEISYYIPKFLWKFWLSKTGPNDLPRDSRVHVYDVYDNDLWETEEMPPQSGSVLNYFETGAASKSLIQEAEAAFYRLESNVEATLTKLIERTYTSGTPTKLTSFPFDRKAIDSLSRYFAFLRFRNSAKYRQVLHSLEEPIEENPKGSLYPAYRPLITEVRRRVILREFLRFLDHSPEETSGHRSRGPRPEHHLASGPTLDAFRDAMDMYCWRLCGAEVCIGLASEDQEFILSDSCFGTLDEGFDEHP
jgi:hypothetical protein